MKKKKIGFSIFVIMLTVLLLSSTVGAVSYGARPYVSNTSTSVNCAGYAFGHNSWYGFDIMTSANIQTWNACDSPSELMAVVRHQITAYISSRTSLSNVLTQKSSYNYSINTSSQFKTVYRLAYHDTQAPTGISITNNTSTSDKFDFHWRYLAADGKWAEKKGTWNSRVCPNDGATNINGVSPYSLTWYMGSSPTGYTYNYSGYNYLRGGW